MVSNNVIPEDCVINSGCYEKVVLTDKNFQRVVEKHNHILDELMAKTIGGKYRNHKLNGVDCNELHINGDILLIWKYHTINGKTFLFLLDIFHLLH